MTRRASLGGLAFALGIGALTAALLLVRGDGGRCASNDSEVARIGPQVYCVADLQRHMERQVYFYSREQAESTVGGFVAAMALRQETERLRRSAGPDRTEVDALRQVDPTYGAPIVVADADVAAYYEQHRGDYQHPERMVLDWIHIPATTASGGGIERARSLYVRAQMNLRDDQFTRLIRRARVDAIDGGRVESVSCDAPRAEAHSAQLPVEIVAAACGTHEGRLLGPISGSDGWYVVRVAHREPPRTISLEAARPEIRAMLRGAAQDVRRRDALRRLVDSLDVGVAWPVIERRIVLDGRTDPALPSAPMAPPQTGPSEAQRG